MGKIFFAIFILALKLPAQVILVPSKDLPLEAYLQRCKSEGYQCTQDYFKQSMITQKSIAFDQFIETLDLYSQDYRRMLPIKIKTLLNSENLNLEQIDLIIKVITRFETIDRNVVLAQIKNELKELSFDVQNLFEERSDSETYVLFNKFLTKKQYLSLRFKQKYTKTIKITPYTEPINALEIHSNELLKGDCEDYTPSAWLEDLKYTTAFENDCGSTQAFADTTQTSSFKWKDYEKPLIYTTAAIVLIGLLSPYQIEVTY
jgi:hypothetical protein